jgi:hypothetical protein
MITAEQCQAHIQECHKLGSAQNISNRRATAIMAICRAWVTLCCEVARYNLVLKDEASLDILHHTERK